MNPIQTVHQTGQSFWYDNIQRKLLENGTMARMIAAGDIRGVTSNPSIFQNAIAKSNDYDAALVPMAWAGWNAEAIFNQLAVEDIRSAADLFLPLYHESRGGDGYVSLEVSPYLAHDTQGTIAEARQLWKLVNRPNLMIKIPATLAGLPAITAVIADGINVNVTLIFSRERYAAVMEAYLQGLEKRAASGLAVAGIASVASFFVSRVDSKVDAKLQEIIRNDSGHAEKASRLMGKAAIANARLAFADFKKVFGTERFHSLKALGAQVQRPLWASTSTKNPAYRDVIYLEELIGVDTVNTVPPQTLEAFRDHGRVRMSLTEDLAGMVDHLKGLEALGISLVQVTDELEAEGVKAFSDAYTSLLQTVDQRRVAAQSELGPLQSLVAERVKTFEAMNLGERIHAHDASLWTSDPAGQAEIVKRMGWLDAPKTSLAMLPELDEFVRSVQDAGFTHVLLLGMGGSSLAPEVMRLVCGVGEVNGKKGLDLTILDSTDPAQVQAAQDGSPVEKTLYLVSSKSGTTSEVIAYFDYFWHVVEGKVGKRAGEHFIAVTDPGTSLEKLAHERGFRHVFTADPGVGGRNSALIAFGLVPAGLLGLDVAEMLRRARALSAQCAAEVPTGRNPGLVLGAVLGEASLHGRDKATILADPLWAPMGAWLEQLIAESSGKQGKGILPVEGEPIQMAKTFSSDRVFVYLKSSGEKEALAAELRSQGQPVLTLAATEAADLLAEFYRWEVATAAACVVLGVNSFDQPDVQDNKTRTNKKVEQIKSKQTLDEGKLIWESSGARIYGREVAAVGSAVELSEAVKGFLAQVGTGDYVAINAYLPRNAENMKTLQELRAKVQQMTGCAVTLGFGPRFLHSTGQYHKGGTNNGVFLQITAEAAADLDIPGEGLTFGELEHAQALGDLEALLARDRRAIRVYLCGKTVQDIL